MRGPRFGQSIDVLLSLCWDTSAATGRGLTNPLPSDRCWHTFARFPRERCGDWRVKTFGKGLTKLDTGKESVSD